MLRYLNITTYNLFVIFNVYKRRISKNENLYVYIHFFYIIHVYNYWKKIFPKILTQSDYMWWYFWKIACILICIIEQFRANFLTGFSLQYIILWIYLSTFWLQWIYIIQHFYAVFLFFLVLILSHYKCMPPAHPFYVVMTTVIGLLCFTVLYLYSYFDP